MISTFIFSVSLFFSFSPVSFHLFYACFSFYSLPFLEKATLHRPPSIPLVSSFSIRSESSFLRHWQFRPICCHPSRSMQRIGSFVERYRVQRILCLLKLWSGFSVWYRQYITQGMDSEDVRVWHDHKYAQFCLPDQMGVRLHNNRRKSLHRCRYRRCERNLDILVFEQHQCSDERHLVLRFRILLKRFQLRRKQHWLAHHNRWCVVGRICFLW